MTFQPLLPLGVLLAVVGPLLVFTAVLAVRAARRWHSPTSGFGGWTRRFLMVLLLAAIGLGPSVPRTGVDTTVTAVDVFFVVDLTGSMAAEDYDGQKQRLDGVRADMQGITADIPGARYSIIAFDSQASRQLPLTTDARSVATWAQTAQREITMYSSGSLVDRPLDELTSALTGAAEQNPSNVRLVFFMSDGENTAEGTRRSYGDLARLVDGGAVLGYGTQEGGRMKEYDPVYANGGSPEGGYITDPTQPGTPDALSVIDEAELQAIAAELGIPYVHRTAPTETAPLTADVDPEQIAADGRRTLTSYHLVLWPLALLLAGLLALEAWSSGRHLGARVGVGRA
ncbi:vWA domain-containing protein [Sanguibacter suaedae]|uniref:VWA domain-containing protein n=1 Tax=Sanguibacter suaedae TaxID=2795737 RepID=A0A934MBY3_9MICO|nr:VWA domain-containing protein [Sanguibacter suaedae]MBI9115811.1 VWA domain-containing protein [Sanguibacter suaedae]